MTIRYLPVTHRRLNPNPAIDHPDYHNDERYGRCSVGGSIVRARCDLLYKFFQHCRTIIAVAPHKSILDSICKPVSCDGVPICTGDIIVGDSDGVVVPLDQADSVFEKAKAILGREDQIRKRMEKGELIFDILGLEKYFQD